MQVDGMMQDTSEALKVRVRNKLASIPGEAMRDMLAKGRWTCDSNWMMAMVMSAGWEAANRANLEVGRAVGKVEMHRLMKLLDLKTPGDDREMLFMIAMAMECFTSSDYWDYEMIYLGPGRMLGIVNECYAYTKTRSIGVESDYNCGCSGLRAGWYQAMGLEIEERIVKCLKDGDPRCEILIEL